MSDTSTSSSRSAPDPSGIAELLQRAADQHATCGVYFTAGAELREAEFLPYPALLEEARRILGGLQANVLSPGAKIALLLERPRDFIPAFWARGTRS